MGEAAGWGTTLHTWKEAGHWGATTERVIQPRMAALAKSGHSRESLYPDTGTHEVSYALHTQARVVERFVSDDRDKREAWKLSWDSEWVTGTTDYEGDILGEPWTDDLKSGRFVPDDPFDLWQLRLYAVCLAILTHAEQVHVSVTHWPRYPASSAPRRLWTPEPIPSTRLLGETLPLLEAARKRVVASWDRPDARPGEHCTYCSCKQVCPALGVQSSNPFS